MINKKIILGLFLITSLGACGAPTAMLGPAYTFTSTGSALQAGFSYGSNELITTYTGKTPLENLKFCASPNRAYFGNLGLLTKKGTFFLI